VHQGPRPLGPTSEDQITIFLYIVDIVTTTFQCLSPQFLSAESSTDDIIYQSAASLVATYFNDLCDCFTTQLLSFCALFKDDIKQIPTVMELAHFLVVKNYSLLPTFQDLYTAFLLFLTLPVTVVTAERSFSKLKLIKTYLRNNAVLQVKWPGGFVN